METWRPIPGFPGYEVSDLGRVRNTRTNAVLKQFRTDRGKMQVTLVRNGGRFCFRVHRLVLTAFIGPPPIGMEGCHNDGDPGNNRLDNLRWDTHEANEADKWRHGTAQFGEHHVCAKLSYRDVVAARERRKSGAGTTALAKEYGVTAAYMRRILNGRSRRCH